MVFLFYAAAPAESPAPAWFWVGCSSLCVTEGKTQDATRNRLSLDAPKTRAYVNRWTAQSIEAQFKYLGPSSHEAPLGSGEMRRQFGFKLRAQDACNLVYAIWRFEPESKLVVSIKTNPGEHTSAECGNRGYRNIKPRQASPVPGLRSGEAHTLRAEMNESELAVFVDDARVWDANLGPAVLSLRGPVGIRSDNVRLEIGLRVRDNGGIHPDYVMGCKSGAGDSD